MPIQELVVLKEKIKQIFVILGAILLTIWGVFLVNTLFLNSYLNVFGIRPRNISGLTGILCSPFLHAGFFHLLNNSISFCLFATLILIKDIRTFILVTIVSWFISGLGVWLFGWSNSLHIGASGVIMGYFGYCVSVGFIEKKVSTLILSLLIIFQYGGVIFSVLPGQIGVSWEGHLFGFLGGIFAAMLSGKKRTPLLG